MELDRTEQNVLLLFPLIGLEEREGWPEGGGRGGGRKAVEMIPLENK